jgi:DNA-binding transcriptional regulator LsrR (DeoR family)
MWDNIVMSRLDELRLIAKVARMYYDQGIRQQEITDRLNLHQSRVSRLLKRARETNIVRISVAAPPGIFSDIEQALEAKFQLKEAVVVESQPNEERMVRDLGAAAAFYIETTVSPDTIIGISSWSRSLLAMVEVMHPTDCGRGGKVVQILGGVGSPGSQYQATLLAQQLAGLIGASSVLLQAPGVVGSAEAKRILVRDQSVREASDLFDKVDIALVGIGSLEPSKLLSNSGNVFSPKEREELKQLGAVGDICLRFFDKEGKPIKSPLINRVIGIELAALKQAHRIVGVAGGAKKIPAICAALRGQWVNVLITDRQTAEGLLALDETSRQDDTKKRRGRRSTVVQAATGA